MKLARRHVGFSQTQLAAAVGVQRSAVCHWESSDGKNPTLGHMRRIAEVTGVQFEWLATGRGRMLLTDEIRQESVAAAHALLIEDTLEMRLIDAFRSVTVESRLTLVEISEQLAAQRVGRIRERTLSRLAPK